MQAKHDLQIIGEVIDKMADEAVERANHADIAVERFSAGVDQLLAWLPKSLREQALSVARAHGYCTRDQVARMRGEA